MGAPAEKKPNAWALYENIFSIPEHPIGQIIEGVLYRHARSAFPHATARSAIGEGLAPHGAR